MRHLRNYESVSAYLGEASVLPDPAVCRATSDSGFNLYYKTEDGTKSYSCTGSIAPYVMTSGVAGLAVVGKAVVGTI